MSVRPEDRAELSAFLDGELDEASIARVRERLARDADYARALEALERVDSALRAIPPSPVSSELAGRMRERLDAERRGAEVVPLRRRRDARPRRSGRWVYAAAALAATLTLALLLRAQLAETPEAPIAERSAPPPAVPELAPLPEIAPTREPAAERATRPDPERIADAPTPVAPAPTAEARDVSPVPQPARVAETPRSEPAPSPVPNPAEEPRDAIAAATDEELLLVLGLEAYGADANELEDLAIIEQLELVELLEQLATGERRG